MYMDTYTRLYEEEKEKNRKLLARLQLLEEDPLARDVREAEERKHKREEKRKAEKQHRGYLAKVTSTVAFMCDALGIPFVWANTQPRWEIPTIATLMFCTFGLGALAAVIAEIIWITTAPSDKKTRV